MCGASWSSIIQISLFVAACATFLTLVWLGMFKLFMQVIRK